MHSTCLRVAALLVSIASPAGLLAAPDNLSAADAAIEAMEAKQAADAQKLKAMIAERDAMKAADIAIKAAQADRDKAAAKLAELGVVVGSAPEATAASVAAVSPVALQAAVAGAAESGTTTTITQKKDGTTTTVIGASDEKKKEEAGKQNFGGLSFGIGIAFTHDLGKSDRVKEAELVNGIVRISHKDNVRARLMLESHYFFTPENRRYGLFGLENIRDDKEPSGFKKKEWGWGPFIALQPGSDTIIDAVGGGFMLGFRRPEGGSESFNLGIGVLYDVDTRILGAGIEPNEPLPTGETAIRYRRTSQIGLLILSSFSF